MSPDGPAIRVLLAEDEEVIREALTELLAREPDMEVIAAVPDGRRAVEEARKWRPDVVIVDLEMPRLDGLGVVTELTRILPNVPVIVLTGHGRPVILRKALMSGARGFLAKGAPGATVADVVRRVRAGSRYVDPVLAAEALTAPASPLTAREAEILAAAGVDRPVRDLARELHLSPGTVRNYLTAIAQKLGVRDRSEAFRTGREQGWI
ncbi:response regulator transcription factor [Kribbella sp. CA-294648]|uniref:response regulator transcription factor n=1 Tax=Kribbella sp. CA-294648 TaxID=3239948 RepID=UPI003D919615